MTPRTIETVLKEHTSEWMSIPGVVGCGIGAHKGKPCIVIFAAKRTKKIYRHIPREADGYRVVVKETGDVRALGSH